MTDPPIPPESLPPTRHILATGGYDPFIRVYDALSQSLIRTLPFPDQHIIRLSFSGPSFRPVADGHPLYLVAGGAPTVLVYDLTSDHNSPNIYTPYTAHTDAITAVGFEPNHSAFVFSASEDGTLHTWIPDTQHAAIHPGPAAFAPFSVNPPNGYYPYNAFAHHGLLGHYQLHGHEFVPTRFENFGPQGMVAIHDAVYHPLHDSFFTVDAKGRLRLWDRRRAMGTENRPRVSVVPHESGRNLQCIELNRDGTTLVTANFDGLVFVYKVADLLTSSNVAPIWFRGNSTYITRVRLCMSGAHLACTTKSKSTKVFRMSDIMRSYAEADTGEDTCSPIRDFAEHPGWVWDVVYPGRRDDFLFTCSSNLRVMLWDMLDVSRSSVFKCHQKPVVCLAIKERGADNQPDGFDSLRKIEDPTTDDFDNVAAEHAEHGVNGDADEAASG